ncbi:MAG: hypothetical protein GXP26_01170 [Planctomycetes bacterium]|nr:hypothetical protein [Planctomycetota bacterium]
MSRDSDSSDNLVVCFEHRVKLEVSRLCREFNDFKMLYVDSKNFDLTKEVAEDFFISHRELLSDDICASICRLMDPAQTGKYENMSFGYLTKNKNDSGLNKALAAIEEQVKPFRKHRDKRIAHADLETHEAYLSNHTGFLPKISLERVEKVLTDMSALIDKMNDLRGSTETSHKDAASNLGTAKELLDYLRRGTS